VELSQGIEKEIIIVNDASSDSTTEAVNDYAAAHPDLHITLFEHTVNHGKGAALHKAISLATGEYLIVQDADLEYDPAEYNELLAPILSGQADVVYGSRYLNKKPHERLNYMQTLGNKFLTRCSNVFSGLKLTDMETCYKLMRTDIAQGLGLKEKRFGFEPEVTAKLAKIKGLRIAEVPISYYGRSFEDGKKIGISDALRAVYCIVKFNVFSNE
jgi:glycosyltransferase involved in cell wall biosynthesis